jgi:hypothetical protein
LAAKSRQIDGIEPDQSLRNALLTIDPNGPTDPIAAKSALAIAQPENFNNAHCEVGSVPSYRGKIVPFRRKIA